MQPWPCPALPGGLREIETEEGEGGQLLHTLAAFIFQGGGNPHHINGMEKRKKKYPTAEERVQWT